MKKEKRKKFERLILEDEVKHMAKLANLTLTEEEVKMFQQQLTEALNYVEVLNELETAGVELTSQVTGLENVVRDDVIKPSISQKEALSGSSSLENNHFKTKIVIEK